MLWGGRFAVPLLVLWLSGCASATPLFDPALDDPEHIIAAAHADDPTPAHPRLGCVGNPLGTPTLHGTLLPTPVLIVGVYDEEMFWGCYVNSGPKPVLVKKSDVHFLCKGQR